MQGKYAKFGDIELTNTDGLTAFDESVNSTEVEHPLIKGAPITQSMGKELRKIKLTLSLHYGVGHNIEQVLSLLDEILETQQPQHFMFADGRYKGKYTLSSINTTVKKTDAKGKLYAADISIVITEYIPRKVIEYRKIEEVKKQPKKEIRKKDDTQYYITREGDKWHLISIMAYGSSEYVFDLRMANPSVKEDPVFAIDGGIEIVLPKVKKKKKTLNNAPWIKSSINPNL